MKYLLMLLPVMLVQVGNYLKNKDANATGSDDAFGNVLIAMAPAVDAVATSNENSLKKALRAVKITIENYLGE
jgi:hypothetical protein